MVAQLGRFVRLAPADRRLLVRAGLHVAALRIGLSLLPFAVVRRYCHWAAPRQPPMPSRSDAAHRVAWAVGVVSRRIPNATCLTRALAAQILLAQLGLASRVWIGVAKGVGTPLSAHAWVESDGQIVLGAVEDLAAYTPLTVFDRPTTPREGTHGKPAPVC